MCLRTISNSIVPKPRHFFVRGRRPRTKKCRGWGTILLDIERKHNVYPIYAPFSGGIYLKLAAHVKRYINYLSKLLTSSFETIYQLLTKLISLLVLWLCFSSKMERAQTTRKNDAGTLRQFNRFLKTARLPSQFKGTVKQFKNIVRK